MAWSSLGKEWKSTDALFHPLARSLHAISKNSWLAGDSQKPFSCRQSGDPRGTTKFWVQHGYVDWLFWACNNLFFFFIPQQHMHTIPVHTWHTWCSLELPDLHREVLPWPTCRTSAVAQPQKSGTPQCCSSVWPERLLKLSCRWKSPYQPFQQTTEGKRKLEQPMCD